ncbi:hypothetical protein PHLCEN_2v9553 [Hermanssonia centrifuga]|uniref:Arrestin-like N-terminal domain-containing protein n=1 Tax=Hermanssonia centrifuga TaxID=98765 RepID=A0A2R6NQK1_9APHY|nr:hypothetical protein PHLCEN_2v9553 [Hermanssonia centrifuga]
MPEAITLVFARKLRVAGEILEGEIHLDFTELTRDKIEEVHVKLRGSIFTKITRQRGQNSITRRERIELVRDTVSVWRHGGAYPPPGTHILKLPFHFTLPSNLLPSCEFSGYRKEGTVGYSIEVVGARSGFRFDKRTLCPMPVLPADPRGAELSRELRAGWTGDWRTVEFARKIRRGIWGDYSHVKMALVIPSLDVLPIFTPIPFTLNVVTVSKPMKREETPEGESVFPAPPLTPKGAEFRLERNVYVRTHNWATTSDGNPVAVLGGLAPTAPNPKFYDHVQVEGMEKVWLPALGDEKKQKGSWKQEVTFRSTFMLTCPPSFESPSMVVTYVMQLKVGFPGIGNDLEGRFPIRIVSSMQPPGAGAWDGPPPELDLPP